MYKFLPMALVALLAINAPGALASQNSPTIGKCINDIKNNAENKFYGCANANDAPCLCKSTQYIDAVNGCSKDNSPATPEEVRENLVAEGGFCQVFANDVPGASQSPSQAPQSSGSPSPTPTPTPTPSPETSATPEATPTSSESSSAVATPETSPSTTASRTTESSSTATKASSETSAAASPGAAASGLSSGAKAGIGIGVAVAVIAVAAVAFCLLRKRKAQPPRHSMEISKPLPGSGRTYPTHDHERDSFDKYANDIEMTSNRYEDMSMGQQPRTMV